MNIQIRVDKKMRAAIYQTIGVALLIYLSNGYYARTFIEARYRVIFLVIICCFYALKTQKKISLLKQECIFAMVIIFLQLITIAFYGFNDSDIFLIFVVLLALLFSNVIEKRDFIEGYRKVIIFISGVSVIIFTAFAIFPFLLDFIPGIFLTPMNSNNSVLVTFATFTVQRLTATTYYRNFGIFSEPGQYQIFLCIGLMIELFYVDKLKLKNLLIILLALLTCNSANGFVVVPMILAAFAIEKRESIADNQKIKRNAMILLFFFILFLFFMIITENEKFIQIYQGAIDKLKTLTQPYGMNDHGSGLERRRAFDIALQMYLEHPFVGIGNIRWGQYKSALTNVNFIMTFTPLNWFALYGTLYGIIVNLSFVAAFCLKPQNMISKIFMMLGMIFMISAQFVVSDPIIWVLIFYGFRTISKRIFVPRTRSLEFKKGWL